MSQGTSASQPACRPSFTSLRLNQKNIQTLHYCTHLWFQFINPKNIILYIITKLLFVRYDCTMFIPLPKLSSDDTFGNSGIIYTIKTIIIKIIRQNIISVFFSTNVSVKCFIIVSHKEPSKRFPILILGNHERACYFSCHLILPDYSQNPQASLFLCLTVLLIAFSSQFIYGRDFRVTERIPAATTTAEPSEGR